MALPSKKQGRGENNQQAILQQAAESECIVAQSTVMNRALMRTAPAAFLSVQKKKNGSALINT